jgi:hypothetical protein
MAACIPCIWLCITWVGFCLTCADYWSNTVSHVQMHGRHTQKRTTTPRNALPRPETHHYAQKLKALCLFRFQLLTFDFELLPLETTHK